MTDLLRSVELFFPQIILGSIVGSVLSVMGILLVLRKLTFFGVTLSQGVSFSVALCLFFGLQGEVYPIVLSCLLVFPLLLFRKYSSQKEDVILGILFVFFAAASQFLLSLGGNVQNHILTAYFGDILTAQVRLNSSGLYIALGFFLAFLSFFRRFLFISFDPDEYRIQIGNPIFFDFLFYIILAASLTVAVNLFGTFYSVSHLLVPVFTLLPFVKSMRWLAFFSILLSLLATVLGFYLSLFGVVANGEMVYFPTSSTIVLVLIVFSILIYLFSYLQTLIKTKFSR